jgi:hypothetical protein
MSDTMQGRRRGVEQSIKPWELEAGDYALNSQGEVWVRLPNGVGPSLLTGWTVTEHDDGTITVQPSILDGDSGWHGYLEHGVWRTV